MLPIILKAKLQRMKSRRPGLRLAVTTGTTLMAISTTVAPTRTTTTTTARAQAMGVSRCVPTFRSRRRRRPLWTLVGRSLRWTRPQTFPVAGFRMSLDSRSHQVGVAPGINTIGCIPERTVAAQATFIQKFGRRYRVKCRRLKRPKSELTRKVTPNL